MSAKANIWNEKPFCICPTVLIYSPLKNWLHCRADIFWLSGLQQPKSRSKCQTVYPPVKKFVLNPWSFVVKFWNHLQEHCWQEIKLCKDEILGEESKWDIIMSSKPWIQSNVGLEPTQKERVKWCEQSRRIKFLLALKVYGNVAVACRKFPLLIWEFHSCHNTH